jgi:hypothetical protein
MKEDIPVEQTVTKCKHPLPPRVQEALGEGDRSMLSHGAAFASQFDCDLASDGPPLHHRTPSHRCAARKETPL